MEFLNERLRSLRKQKNLSMAKLAEMSGVSQSHISDLENGKKKPSLDVLGRLSQALKVDILYFFDENARLLKESLPENMPEYIQDFIMKPENVKYLVSSEKAAKYGVKTEVLDQILEALKYDQQNKK